MRIRNWIRSLTEGIIFVIDNFERLAIVIVSRIAPWAAPLAPAFFVARAVQKHFETPLWVAVAVGVTLEAVGIAATHITLEMYQYNQSRRKADPAAPFDVGLLVASVYFVVGISLTVILEIFPDLVVIAPAAFFLLAIVAYMSLALMSGHARRLQGIDQEKQSRKQKRHPGGTKPELPTGTKPEFQGERLPEFDTVGAALEYYEYRNIRNISFTERQQLREIIWFRDGKKCGDCGENLELAEETHCHHIVPQSEGGSDRPSNLMVLCRSCHQQRHGKGGTAGTTRDRARAIISGNPEITGSELGRQLGRSERLGRRLKAELSGNGSGPESVSEEYLTE